MSDGVFKPAELQAAPIELLGVVYTLGDVKRSDQHRLQRVSGDLGKLPDEDATPEQNDEAAHLMCEFIAITLNADTDEVTKLLVDAYDADEVGVRTLQRAQGHVAKHLAMQDAAGEA